MTPFRHLSVLMLGAVLGLAGCGATVPQKMGTLMEQGQYAQAITLGEGTTATTPEIDMLLQQARRDQTQAYAEAASEGQQLERRGDLSGALAAWQKAVAARPSEEGQAALQRIEGKLTEDRETRLLASETALIQGYRQALAAHPPEGVARSIQEAFDRLAQSIIQHAQELQSGGDTERAARFLALVPDDPQAKQGLALMKHEERRDLLSRPLEPTAPLKVQMDPGEPLKDLPLLPSSKEVALDQLLVLQGKGDLPAIRQWLDHHGDKGWLDANRRRDLEQQLATMAAKLMSRADAAFLAEDLTGAVKLVRRAVALDPSVPQVHKRLKEWEGMLENLNSL